MMSAAVSIVPAVVSREKRSPLWRIVSTVTGRRHATRPASHSLLSRLMTDSLESSQKSWPLCFSCQLTRYCLSNARKSRGV